MFVVVERIPPDRHDHFVDVSVIDTRPAMIDSCLDVLRQLINDVDSKVCWKQNAF
jgi:hypothetical protein